MWIEALSTAHIEQKNDLEIFSLPPRERVKTADALFAIPEKTLIALDGCVGPATYHCAFKQMNLEYPLASYQYVESLGLQNQPTHGNLEELRKFEVFNEEERVDTNCHTGMLTPCFHTRERHLSLGYAKLSKVFKFAEST
ncbi:hypothetical protein TNCV_2870411 [Trichonephila clavipes]|nr:hypothetical protein TNCV_2870411 [Trichonephila clavipes]